MKYTFIWQEQDLETVGKFLLPPQNHQATISENLKLDKTSKI